MIPASENGRQAYVQQQADNHSSDCFHSTVSNRHLRSEFKKAVAVIRFGHFASKVMAARGDVNSRIYLISQSGGMLPKT